MTGAASTQGRTFESAETLAQGVAEWLCALAQASDRDFAICLSGGSTPRRLYERLATPRHCVAFPVEPLPLVLGRRALRAARPSRQQLPDGPRRAAFASPDSRRKYSRDPDRGLVAGAGRCRVRNDIEALPRRRHAFTRPAAVRRDAARNWRGRTYGLTVPRPAGIAGEPPVGSRRSSAQNRSRASH